MMIRLVKTLFLAILVLHFLPALAAGEPIFEAAKKGDLDAVRSILEGNPSKLRAIDEQRYTALHWACIRAKWDVARYLIDKGADLNAVGGDGGTPLNWAAHHDDVEMIELMLDRGAGLNGRNRWGMTELHTAIWRGNRNVVELLLDRGSDPSIETNEGWTALHYAYRSGHDDLIEMLIARGLSETARDHQGRYPRHLYFKKPAPIELNDGELDEYVGKYYIQDLMLLELWREGSRLVAMEYGPDEIYPVARDFFYFKHAPWTLIFSRDEGGKIDHAQLSFIRRSYTIHRK